LTGEKKTKKRSKDICYSNIKPSKHYYLNKRKQIKEEGPNPYTLVKKIPFFSSLIFPPLGFGAATTHLQRKNPTLAFNGDRSNSIAPRGDHFRFGSVFT